MILKDIGKLTKEIIDSVKDKEKCLWKHGADGVIYAINEGVVLKLFNRKNTVHDSSKKCAKYVFRIGSELHKKGVQVPEYFGIFKPMKLPKLNHWGVFMEKINGLPFCRLSSKEKKIAEQQYEEQRQLIHNLGYFPGDGSIFHNTLYDTTSRKLFLYDLVRWYKR